MKSFSPSLYLTLPPDAIFGTQNVQSNGMFYNLPQGVEFVNQDQSSLNTSAQTEDSSVAGIGSENFGSQSRRSSVSSCLAGLTIDSRLIRNSGMLHGMMGHGMMTPYLAPHDQPNVAEEENPSVLLGDGLKPVYTHVPPRSGAGDAGAICNDLKHA
jgi:hypothetical protein